MAEKMTAGEYEAYLYSVLYTGGGSMQKVGGGGGGGGEAHQPQ